MHIFAFAGETILVLNPSLMEEGGKQRKGRRRREEGGKRGGRELEGATEEK